MMPPRIKICGLTRAEDATLAATLGADALGVVLWAGSPRAITAAQARAVFADLPRAVTRVGVFVSPTVDEAAEAVDGAGLDVVQLHAVADPAPFVGRGWPVLWSGSLEQGTTTAPAGTTLLLDAHDPVQHGGTGRTIDWARAASLAAGTPLILAGGLTADNVAAAIARVRPHGIDVSSGVESAPGIKSPDLLRRFVAAARHALEVRHS